MTDDLDLVRLRELLDKATPGERHCPEMLKPGGCQLHNLQCGYPDCDRKPGAKEAIELLRMRSPTLARAVLNQDARITALLDENAALKRDVERMEAGAKALIKTHEQDCRASQREIEGWQTERNEARQAAEAAEASRDALAGKLKEVAEIAALMDRLGGLGYENHARLKRIAAIAETPAPALGLTAEDREQIRQARVRDPQIHREALSIHERDRRNLLAIIDRLTGSADGEGGR